MGPIVPKQNWLRSTEAQEEDVVQELLVGALPMEATNKLQCMEALLVGEVLEDKFMVVTPHLQWVMAVFNYLQDVITVLGVGPVEGVSLCREKVAMAAVALTVRASAAVETTIVVIHHLRSGLEVVIDAMTTSVVVTAEIVTAGTEDGATIVEFR